MNKILIDKSTVKLALEALNTAESDYKSPAWELGQEAFTALQEALAVQPAPKVVDCHATGVCVQSGLRAEQPAPAITPEHLLALAQTASLELDKVIAAFKMAEQREVKDVVIDNMGDPFIVKAYVTPQPAQQCKWPTCQSEEYQQALAEQIRRELVGEQPAQQERPSFAEWTSDYVRDNLHKLKPAQQEPTKAMIDAAERIDWSDSDVRGNIVNMWQAMCAVAEQPAQQEEPVGRTDRQIVDETEKLAAWLLSWSFNLQPESKTPMRESTHPLAKSCWSAACHIQEMLTATDPENAVAELEGDAGEEAAPQPAQRTWVGLTDKEAMQICVDCRCLSEDWFTLLDAIEVTLRSKNEARN